MGISEKQFDALLNELVGIRRALSSISIHFGESNASNHDDLQDIVASIDSFTLAAASEEADSLDD